MEYERFAPLVTPHTAAMARVAAALVDFPDAEDAAQEALMRAWRAWPSLREPDATRAWLMQITVNVCRSWCSRGHGLRLGAEERLGVASLERESGQVAPGASEHVSALDVRQALLTLNEDMRVAIALRFYVGMDSTEIGALLGESSATIRSRLRRAIISLRRALDDVEFVPTEIDARSGRNV